MMHLQFYFYFFIILMEIKILENPYIACQLLAGIA
jgi:hypothetical protein